MVIPCIFIFSRAFLRRSSGGMGAVFIAFEEGGRIHTGFMVLHWVIGM